MKLNKEPLVVVAIATLGDRKTFLKTLDSIDRQNYRNISVKIVCPEIKIPQLRNMIKEKFNNFAPVDFIVEKDKGLSNALNQAFEMSENADYFGWINDDDYFTNGAIARAVDIMEKNNTVAAFGHLVYVDENLKELATNNFGKFGYWISRYGPNLIPQPGCFFKRSAIKEKNLLESNYKYAMDLDLWFRLEKIGNFSFIKQPQAHMLWHKDSITIRERNNSLKEAFEIRKKYRKNILGYGLIFLMWFPTKLVAHISTKII